MLAHPSCLLICCFFPSLYLHIGWACAVMGHTGTRSSPQTYTCCQNVFPGSTQYYERAKGKRLQRCRSTYWDVCAPLYNHWSRQWNQEVQLTYFYAESSYVLLQKASGCCILRAKLTAYIYIFFFLKQGLLLKLQTCGSRERFISKSACHLNKPQQLKGQTKQLFKYYGDWQGCLPLGAWNPTAAAEQGGGTSSPHTHIFYHIHII